MMFEQRNPTAFFVSAQNNLSCFLTQPVCNVFPMYLCSSNIFPKVQDLAHYPTIFSPTEFLQHLTKEPLFATKI